MVWQVKLIACGPTGVPRGATKRTGRFTVAPAATLIGKVGAGEKLNRPESPLHALINTGPVLVNGALIAMLEVTPALPAAAEPITIGAAAELVGIVKVFSGAALTVPCTKTWKLAGVALVWQVKFAATGPAAVPAAGANCTGIFAAAPGAMVIGKVGAGV